MTGTYRSSEAVREERARDLHHRGQQRNGRQHSEQAVTTSLRAARLVALSLLVGGTIACASAGSSGRIDGATTERGCPSGAARSERGAILGQVIGKNTKGTVIGAAGPAAGDGRVRDPQVALRQICAMMAASAQAWNRGQLDAFVADYMEGEGTTYIGSRGIVRGPAAIRDAYAPRFGPGGVRDSLSFERVEVDLLAPDLANTIAWYVLMRGDSITARGPTSLVMRRVKGSWKIVHDHSS
jgi:ketosteroid isomerase-like protein